MMTEKKADLAIPGEDPIPTDAWGNPSPTPDAADLLETITNLLQSGDYAWCRETLEGIHTTVEKTGRRTIRQQEAVEHIIEGRLKHDAHLGGTEFEKRRGW